MDKKPLTEVYRDLLLSGQFSDFTIRCGGHTFPVHRAVICPQTHFFDVAANGPFAEGVSKTLDLPADDPGTILRVLSFLYTREYDEKEDIIALNRSSKGNSSDNVIESPPKDAKDVKPDNLHAADDNRKTPTPTKAKGKGSNPKTAASEVAVAFNNLRVYVAADKFDVEALKNLASQRFMRWLTKNTACAALPHILRELMLTVPGHDDDLRNRVVKHLAGSAKGIMEMNGMLPVMQEFGVLAAGLLIKVIEETSALRADKISLKTAQLDLKRLLNEAKLQRREVLEEHLTNDEFWKSDWQRLSSRLNSITRCKGCNASMSVRIAGPPFKFGETVQCKACNTKH